jgi:hypothetical protein
VTLLLRRADELLVVQPADFFEKSDTQRAALMLEPMAGVVPNTLRRLVFAGGRPTVRLADLECVARHIGSLPAR